MARNLVQICQPRMDIRNSTFDVVHFQRDSRRSMVYTATEKRGVGWLVLLLPRVFHFAIGLGFRL